MRRPSGRLGRLPQYAVAELAAIKRGLLAQGKDVIDLSVGDADFPPPAVAAEALREAAGDPRLSRCGFQVGLMEFREAVAAYMQRRFDVTLDPMTEILPLLGSKEGLAHLPLALVDPGDVCVLPEPGYPPYIGGTVLANADIELVPLVPEHGFLVELELLPRHRVDRARLVFLNYPNNPTTAVAPVEYLERTVAFCRRHGIAIAYDNPYCELTFDGYVAPSILQVDGAREVALEFHSLSKSFAMTGWRLGWAAGGAALIETLVRVKTYVDTGPFLAVQYAGARVLELAEAIIRPICAQLTERRDAGVDGLRQAGIVVERPKATMYLWPAVPAGTSSADFGRALLEHEGLLVVPGVAFGAGGEGYFRVALTVSPERLRDAGSRVARTLERLGAAGARA